MFVNKSTFMDKYVKTAQQLFDGMVPLISTDTAWPKSLNDKWISKAFPVLDLDEKLC